MNNQELIEAAQRAQVQQRIECAIARHWPDLEKILNVTGVSAQAVQDVVERLEAINGKQSTVHTCALHMPGSETCFDWHMCRCVDCRAAADALRRHRIQTLLGGKVEALKAAHGAYNSGSRSEQVILDERLYQQWSRLTRSKAS